MPPVFRNQSLPVLRQAVAADVPGIQRVRHSVKENQLTSTVIRDADVLEAIERTGRGWVIEVDGQIAGFSIGNRETGNIWALFVDPAFEGQGYGRRLHDEMLAWLAGCGLDLLYLSTEANTRAESFYATAGWTRCGVLPDGEVRFERKPRAVIPGSNGHGSAAAIALSGLAGLVGRAEPSEQLGPSGPLSE